MENMQIYYEWIGYAASVLVVLSLMMSSIIYLRWINLAGAAFMSLYGFLIHALPVGFLNFAIVIIDLYYLKKIYFAEDYFSILKIRPSSYYLEQFLKFYNQEISKVYPSFDIKKSKSDVSLFILRNMIPAGLFLGEKVGTETLNITLDFVIPEYRDFKIGNFLFYKNKKYFEENNIYKVMTTTSTKEHVEYFEKMGFKKDKIDNNNVTLVKNI